MDIKEYKKHYLTSYHKEEGFNHNKDNFDNSEEPLTSHYKVKNFDVHYEEGIKSESKWC